MAIQCLIPTGSFKSSNSKGMEGQCNVKPQPPAARAPLEQSNLTTSPCAPCSRSNSPCSPVPFLRARTFRIFDGGFDFSWPRKVEVRPFYNKKRRERSNAPRNLGWCVGAPWEWSRQSTWALVANGLGRVRGPPRNGGGVATRLSWQGAGCRSPCNDTCLLSVELDRGARDRVCSPGLSKVAADFTRSDPQVPFVTWRGGRTDSALYRGVFHVWENPNL